MSSESFRSFKHPLPSVFLIAILYLSLAFIVSSNFSHSGGNFSLVKFYAESLREYGSWSEPYHIAPVQPVLLAFVSLVLPINDMTMRFVQIGLMLALILMTYLVTELFFSRRVALFSALLIALWPPFILQIFSQSTEIILSFFLMTSFYFMTKAWRLDAYAYAVVAGLSSALAALADPIGLYIPIIFLLPVGSNIFHSWRREFDVVKKKISIAGIFLLFFILSLLPWHHRNLSVFGDGAPLIQKSWEVDFLRDEDTLSQVIDAFAPRYLPVITSGLGNFFLIPYSLDSLDKNTPLSYKAFLLDAITGKERVITLSASERLVLIFKILGTLLHWTLLAFAIFGLWRSRNRWVALLYLVIIIYFIIATFSYGVPNNFGNTSQLNGFFFSLLPLTVMFGVSGFLSIWRNRKS